MNDAQNPTNPTLKPYKGMQFDAFLHEIGNSNIQNWTLLAEALGVDRSTIVEWKKHPLAKQALQVAINDSLRKMEEVGAADWKMHREKLKMYGIKDKTTLEHEVDEDQLSDILDTLEKKTDYAKLGREIAEQIVAPHAPVQNQGQEGPSNSVPTESNSGEAPTGTA